MNLQKPLQIGEPSLCPSISWACLGVGVVKIRSPGTPPRAQLWRINVLQEMIENPPLDNI